jgi:hypothetical protein
MACVSEAIGLALPNSAGAPAPYESRDQYAIASGEAVMNLLEKNIRARDIVTRKSLENAARIVACTGVEAREPVGEAERFGAEVGRVYCFTEISGAEEPTTIFHVWYQDGVERARVELGVRAASWRTWSSKRIPPAWAGDWKVVVEDAEGMALAEVELVVGEATGEPAADTPGDAAGEAEPSGD